MPSRVAGIVDQRGGLRVVVTDGSLYCHLNPGEVLYVVRGYTVEEPVDVRDWPKIVKIVEDYIKQVA